MKQIDFRSDTVTKPCLQMRQLMAQADVGDDVFADDPTVNKLQELAAEMTGHEAALFAPSGTQSNLLALMSHCQRGDEYIVGQDAHTYKYEGGGAAVLGSIQPQPIDFAEDGTLPLDKVKLKIKPNDHHFARTRLLAIENTVSGVALPMEYMTQVREFCDQHKLSLHLDGARVFNAAVHHKVALSEITRGMDSVSICLSKGLGAPVGSLICGSRDFINEAHKWRKMLGGGMRQAGILAAAAIYALENNIQRLEQDHNNAAFLAKELAELDVFEVKSQHTNMLFANYRGGNCEQFCQFMQQSGIVMLPGNTMRLVLHKDINRDDILYTIEQIKKFIKG